MEEIDITKELQSTPSKLVKPLRTYQSDIAEAIKEKQGSVLKIAVAEEERREKEKVEGTLSSPKNRSLFILSILFVVLSGIIVGSFFFFKNKNTSVIPSVPLAEYTTITTDNVSEIEIEAGDLLGFLKSFQEKIQSITAPINGIERIVITEKDTLGKKTIVTPSQFLNLLEARTTPSFLRSLTDSLVVGVTIGEKNNVFLLIKSNSYPNSFSGMLSWERGLFDDLKDFFAIGVQPVTNFSLFKDKVVKNQDTRVLVDDTGNTVLLYTFLGQGQDLLLITNSEDVVGIVTDRLTQAKLPQ